MLIYDNQKLRLGQYLFWLWILRHLVKGEFVNNSPRSIMLQHIYFQGIIVYLCHIGAKLEKFDFGLSSY